MSEGFRECLSSTGVALGFNFIFRAISDRSAYRIPVGVFHVTPTTRAVGERGPISPRVGRVESQMGPSGPILLQGSKPRTSSSRRGLSTEHPPPPRDTFSAVLSSRTGRRGAGATHAVRCPLRGVQQPPRGPTPTALLASDPSHGTTPAASDSIPMKLPLLTVILTVFGRLPL